MNGWVKVCKTTDVLENGGSCVKVNDEHIAVFNFGYQNNEWYAVQNVCPHQNQSVLSRGLIGEDEGEPKVACPLHKNTFSLKSGAHLGGNKNFQLKVYPVEVKGEDVYVQVNSSSKKGV